MGQHTDSPVEVENVAVSEYAKRPPAQRHRVEVVLSGRRGRWKRQEGEGGRRREKEGERGRRMSY